MAANEGESLAPVVAMALAAIDIAANHQRLLDEELVIDDDREVILQEIVLPTLLRIHSKARLRSDLSLVESLSNSQPIAAAIKGIFFSDRIKDRGLTNAAIRKMFDQLIVIVNLIGQHMDPGETLMMTNGHVGRHHTAEDIRVGNQLLRNEDRGVICSDPRAQSPAVGCTLPYAPLLQSINVKRGRRREDGDQLL